MPPMYREAMPPVSGKTGFEEQNRSNGEQNATSSKKELGRLRRQGNNIMEVPPMMMEKLDDFTVPYWRLFFLLVYVCVCLCVA